MSARQKGSRTTGWVFVQWTRPAPCDILGAFEDGPQNQKGKQMGEIMWVTWKQKHGILNGKNPHPNDQGVMSHSRVQTMHRRTP